MIQGDTEWFEARCGNVTASRIADVMARTKSGYSASRANYMSQLVCERLTGEVAESYTNAAMQWGIDTEPQARSAYESVTGVLVMETGVHLHPSIERSGASPDGLVGDDGLLEIKCPNTATHIKTLLGSNLDNKYFLQMQWQMACTERQWCDFVSYDPRMPEDLQYYSERVDRDDDVIADICVEVKTFLLELDAMVYELNKLRGKND
jgi:putative phage-type endonuclease